MKKYIAIILTAIVTTVVATAALNTFRIANNSIFFGLNSTADKLITFNYNAGASNPVFGLKSGVLQFTNDGSTYFPVSAGVPTGAMMEWGMETAPTGWVLTDGAAYSRTNPTYSALFAVIGTKWGIGDGTTTFNVPDFRGAVTRMYDDGTLNLDSDRASRIAWPGSQTTGTFSIIGDTHSGTNVVDNVSALDLSNLAIGKQITSSPTGTVYVSAILSSSSFQISGNSVSTSPGATLTVTKGVLGDYVGSYELDELKSHTHTFNQGFFGNGAGSTVATTTPAAGGIAFSINSTGGSESRGKNVYVMKIIKL